MQNIIKSSITTTNGFTVDDEVIIPVFKVEVKYLEDQKEKTLNFTFGEGWLEVETPEQSYNKGIGENLTLEELVNSSEEFKWVFDTLMEDDEDNTDYKIMEMVFEKFMEDCDEYM